MRSFLKIDETDTTLLGKDWTACMQGWSVLDQLYGDYEGGDLAKNNNSPCDKRISRFRVVSPGIQSCELIGCF